MRTKLAIIIVHYNTPYFLDECLNSLLEQSLDVKHQIIVIDNKSKGLDIDCLSKKYPEVVFKILNQNYGFSKANNIGIKLIDADFYLLLNPDTKFINKKIGNVIERLERERELGIIGCKLLNPDGTNQNSIGTFPRLFRIFANFSGLNYIAHTNNIEKIIRKLQPILSKSFIRFDSDFNNERYVEMVWGAFFLIKKEVFDKVGLLDEEFFLGGEENELCYRASKNNYKILYYPNYEIIHVGSAVVRKNRILSLNSQIRGYIYYYKKHFKANLPILLKTIYLSIIVRYILLKLNILKRFTVVDSELDNIKYLREILKKEILGIDIAAIKK